jgi:ribosomal protein S18 acetylase RimI-like enzyme
MPKPAELAPIVSWRSRTRRADAKAIKDLVRASGVFSLEELRIAEELIRDRLHKGRSSDYEFLLAELGEELVGYACFGRIPLTRASYDLYWIVVSPDHQRHGIGRQLLALVEDNLRARGRGDLYVETSSRRAYQAAQRFYASSGYQECARFPNFYAPGDAKIVFVKRI